MAIYVSSSVNSKVDEYVDFLMSSCNYSLDEAETRRWEVEYQIFRKLSPVLMTPGTIGTINFRDVLQRQEIKRLSTNRNELIKFIKRRRGARGTTQWSVEYSVSNNGDVFITEIEYHNIFSESLAYKDLQQLIEECIAMTLQEHVHNAELDETIDRSFRMVLREHLTRNR